MKANVNIPPSPASRLPFVRPSPVRFLFVVFVGLPPVGFALLFPVRPFAFLAVRLSSLPSLLPSPPPFFLLSFLPSLPPSFLPSFLSLFLPSFLAFFLPSLSSFLFLPPSLLPALSPVGPPCLLVSLPRPSFLLPSVLASPPFCALGGLL